MCGCDGEIGAARDCCSVAWPSSGLQGEVKRGRAAAGLSPALRSIKFSGGVRTAGIWRAPFVGTYRGQANARTAATIWILPKKRRPGSVDRAAGGDTPISSGAQCRIRTRRSRGGSPRRAWAERPRRRPSSERLGTAHQASECRGVVAAIAMLARISLRGMLCGAAQHAARRVIRATSSAMRSVTK